MDNHFVSYRLFDAFEHVMAFTTTRESIPGMELPRFTGNPFRHTKENREALALALGIDAKQLIFPRQTHTNCVAEIFGYAEDELQETDALVTSKKGLCLCVQTADCVPVLLFDPKQMAVAAIHAGWRGTVKHIAGKAILKMTALYQSSPSDIRAVIGPSIGPEVYEVGDEVVNAVRANIPNPEKTFHKYPLGKYHLNLWEANRQILLERGIQSENIAILGECTYQNSGKYFSARREGIETGRMVSGIMLV